MNRIVLIGNGFDLAHGLETSYTHFLKWLKNQKIVQNASNYFEHIKVHPNLNFGNGEISASSFFEKYYKNYNDLEKFISDCPKCRFTYKNNFLDNLIHKAALQNWVDIEEEYSKKLFECAKNYDANRLKKLHQDLEQIKNDLEEYLRIVNQKEIDVKEYLKNSITNQTSALNSILLLNFNYTSFEEYYKTSQMQAIHIHGELKNNKNPIIFGYGNENAKQYKEIEEMNNNDLLINMKSILYGNTSNYKKLEDFAESDMYEIFILGHSCGLSDGTLLSMLFNHKNCFSIKSFYYKLENGTDNYLDIRMNISRHFSDKNTFRKKVMNKELCCELK